MRPFALALVVPLVASCSLALPFDQEVEADELPYSVFDVLPEPGDDEDDDVGLCDDLCDKLWSCVPKKHVCHYYSVAFSQKITDQKRTCTSDCTLNHAPTESQLDYMKSRCSDVAIAYVAGSETLQATCDFPLQECADLCNNGNKLAQCLSIPGDCLETCKSAPAVFWDCVSAQKSMGADDVCDILQACRERFRDRADDRD